MSPKQIQQIALLITTAFNAIDRAQFKDYELSELLNISVDEARQALDAAHQLENTASAEIQGFDIFTVECWEKRLLALLK